MKGHVGARAAGGVILAGLVVVSRDLGWAWQHSPFDRGGGWIAAGWLLLVVARVPWATTVPAGGPLAVALVAGLVGFVGELNVAKHLALTAAVVAWVPGGKQRWMLAGAGLAWWPLLGWMVARLGVSDVAWPWRLAVLAGGGGMSVWWQRTPRSPAAGRDA